MSNIIETESNASLSEAVYEELKRRISGGMYEPGEKLVTKEIAEDFGVSRTPVIVAVNRLAAEGIATAVPQQGVFVKKFSVRELHDILVIRRMIELYSIGPVIRTMQFDRQAAKKLTEVSAELYQIDVNDYVRAFEIENAFHSMIIHMTGNAELEKVFASEHCLDVTRQVYQIAGMGISDVEIGRSEHKKLVELMEAGDEEGARAVMEIHTNRPIELLNWLITTGRMDR